MTDATSLTIHEYRTDDGAIETVRLEASGDAILLYVGAGRAMTLPALALDRVMRRFAKPLADGIEVEGPRLDLGRFGALVLFRHLARFDVIARDFLVWSPPGEEPIAELAVAVTGALLHLAKTVGESLDAPSTR
jgi:hypothetical protein